MTHARWFGMLLTLWPLAAGAAGQATTSTSSDTPEYALIQAESLMQADPTITNVAEQNRQLADKVRRIPALLSRFDTDWAQSQYRPLAKSLLIDALTTLRGLNDPAATDEALAAAANNLLKVTAEPVLKAKAEYALLAIELTRQVSAASNQPAASQPAGSQPAARAVALARMAQRYAAFGEAYRQTPYGPLGLYSAAMIEVEAGLDDQAIKRLDKLAADYPHSPTTQDGLMLLVQLHQKAGRKEAVLAAKRKLVADFPDSDAAIQYRADIAQSESLGQPLHLRFRALDGTKFDLRDHKGKTVWVYFFLSAANEARAAAVAGDIVALQKLAGEKAAVVAIGADAAKDSDTVARLLTEKGAKCPVLLDDQFEVASHCGVQMAPSVVIVDAQGNLARIVPGPNIVQKLVQLAASQPATRAATQPTTTTTTAPAAQPAR